MDMYLKKYIQMYCVTQVPTSFSFVTLALTHAALKININPRIRRYLIVAVTWKDVVVLQVLPGCLDSRDQGCCRPPRDMQAGPHTWEGGILKP